MDDTFIRGSNGFCGHLTGSISLSNLFTIYLLVESQLVLCDGFYREQSCTNRVVFLFADCRGGVPEEAAV